MKKKTYNARLLKTYKGKWDDKHKCRTGDEVLQYDEENTSFDFDDTADFKKEVSKLLKTEKFRDIAPADDENTNCVYVSFVGNEGGNPCCNPKYIFDCLFHITKNMEEDEVAKMFI